MFGWVDNNAVAQVTLGLCRFFAHQVAHTRTIALDFTSTSHRKTLLGAGMGLHLRHDKNIDFEKWSAKVSCFSETANKKAKIYAEKRICLSLPLDLNHAGLERVRFNPQCKDIHIHSRFFSSYQI